MASTHTLSFCAVFTSRPISFPNEFSGSVLLRFLSLGVIVFVHSFARGLVNSRPVYFYNAGGRRLNFECTVPSTVVFDQGKSGLRS